MARQQGNSHKASDLETLQVFAESATLESSKLKSGLNRPTAINGYGASLLPYSNNVDEKIALKAFKVPYSQVAPMGLSGKCPISSVPKPRAYTPGVMSTELIIYHYMAQPTNFSQIFAAASYIQTFFYSSKTKDVASLKMIYSSYATFFAMLAGRDLQSAFKGILDSRNMTLRVKTHATPEAFSKAVNDTVPGTSLMFKKLQDEGFATLREILTICSVLLQTIGRKIGEKAVNPWFIRRIRAASAATGATGLEEFALSPPVPQIMERANEAMSGAFKFRKCIFLMIADYADTQTITGSVCRHVLGLLAYAEMGYVTMIERYILEMTPEILSSKWLDGEEESLKAMALFIKDNYDYAPYIKFIYEHELCYPIHRQNLTRVIMVAQVIASLVQPSYNHYYLDSSSTFYKQAEELVKKYFSLDLQAKAANLNYGMSISERLAFIRLADSHIENSIREEEAEYLNTLLQMEGFLWSSSV